MAGFNYIKVPLDAARPFYKFTIRLSGITYTFHIRWNERAGRWFFDLATASDLPLVSSVPLLIRKNLIARFATAGLPPGYFFVLDETGQNTEPGRNAWGTSHSLYYAEPTA